MAQLATYLAAELEAVNPGDSGAIKIGLSPIGTITDANVQAALESVDRALGARLAGVQDDTSAIVTFQPYLRLSGAGVTLTNDDLNQATVATIPGIGDTPFIDTIEADGVAQLQLPIVNFIGANSVVEDPLNNRIDIDVSTPQEELTPIATSILAGKARLSVDPEDPADPVVVETSDPRMIDARPPIAHSHGVEDLPLASLGEEDPLKIVAANDTRLYDMRTPSDFSVSLRKASGEISLMYICTSTTRPTFPKHGQVIYETDTDLVMKNISLPATPDWQPVGAGAASITIQEEGVTIAQRAVINVIGEAATVIDDGVSKTELHIPGLQVQSSGTNVGDPHAILNVIGATVTEDLVNSRINVTITGGSGSVASTSAEGGVRISVAADDSLHPVALGYNEYLRRDYKNSVRAATTAALPTFTYSAGVITATANGALPAIDGVTLVNGDVLLVKNEAGATQARHGRYQVSQVGSVSTPFILARTQDFNDSSKVTPGIRIPVEEGTVNGGKVYKLDTTGTITLDTTNLVFSSETPLAASNTVQGVVTLSAAGSNVAVATNDTRVPTSAQALALAGSYGSPDATNVYITTTDPRVPTQAENDAMQQITGQAAPSSTNRFVTNSDSRLTSGGGGSSTMRSLVKKGI